MAESNNPAQRKIDPHFATKAIHVGQDPDQWTYKDVVPPISLTTTYKQYSPNNHAGFEYSRSGNPTRQVLQTCIASLDGAKHALTYASGLAATAAVVQLLSPEDHVLCADDMYGGTNRYFSKIATKNRINLTLTDMTDSKSVEKLILPDTKLVWLESPTNPGMKVADVEAISRIVHNFNKNIIVVVDNTFQTPYFQRPLDLGADIVVYSMSKYMNGHSDVVMGALVLNDSVLYDSLNYFRNACGTMSSPFDCYLVNRGLKTLHVRMKEHMKNGFAVARFLEQHPLVEKVLYPGLPSHPQHEVAVRQCSGFSGMVSFYIKGGRQEATKFLQAVKVFCLAESLGGFESLAEHPALMTHASVDEQERDALNISNNLIRLSVGLETEQDLLNDLDQALKASVQ